MPLHGCRNGVVIGFPLHEVAWMQVTFVRKDNPLLSPFSYAVRKHLPSLFKGLSNLVHLV